MQCHQKIVFIVIPTTPKIVKNTISALTNIAMNAQYTTSLNV